LTIDPERERERIFQKLGFRCICGHCTSKNVTLLQEYKRTPTSAELDTMIAAFDSFVSTSREFFKLDNVTLMSDTGNSDKDLLSDDSEPTPSEMFLSKFRITDEDSTKIR